MPPDRCHSCGSATHLAAFGIKVWAPEAMCWLCAASRPFDPRAWMAGVCCSTTDDTVQSDGYRYLMLLPRWVARDDGFLMDHISYANTSQDFTPRPRSDMLKAAHNARCMYELNHLSSGRGSITVESAYRHARSVSLATCQTKHKCGNGLDLASVYRWIRKIDATA